MAVGTGTGTVITFPTSFSAAVEGISLSGASREAIRVTLIQDQAGPHKWVQDAMYEAGEASFDIQFNPAEGMPLQDLPGNLVIQWAGATNWTMADSFITSYNPSAEIGAYMTAAVTFKFGAGISIG